MPELPEVETIRRGLLKTVKGKRIKAITILLPKMVRRHASPSEVTRRARGKVVVDIRRRGKTLLFFLDSRDVLIFRLGMTGQMLWSHPKAMLKKDKYTHVIIDFGKRERILFRDMRQFGEVYITTESHLEKVLAMGAEPLEEGFSLGTLTQITSSSMRIKQLLMDQRKIAGIGNIYSDEILFVAGIHPLKPADALRKKELLLLHRAIGEILTEAIARKGDTIGQYRDLFGESGGYQEVHRVYQRSEEPCYRCGSLIRRIKLAGRSCHFCPSCQK